MHFGEGLTERDHFFGYKEETAEFCLGGGRHHVFNDVGYGENRVVAGRHGDVFREHDVGASAAARFANVEVCGVGVAGKDHVAGAVCDAFIGVRGEVVQELKHVGVGVGVFRGRRLLLTELAQGNNDFVVDGAGVVPDGANELLDAKVAGGVKRRAVGSFCRVLNIGAVK